MAQRTLPTGFKVNGLHSGVKRYNKDLALMYSEAPCKAAGVFTRSKIKAAPVLVTKQILSKKMPIHAVVINSGNANCCTGSRGISDAKKMVHAAKDALGLKYNNVCVSSTGIIGKLLPIDIICKGITTLAGRLSDRGIRSRHVSDRGHKSKPVSARGLRNFAKAILTTDKKRKIRKAFFRVGSRDVAIVGVCKGAGMVHPNMATMLAYVMTDANIEKRALVDALRTTVNSTFNRISIDGDMSTNDSVLLLANGCAQNKMIRTGTGAYRVFLKELEKVMSDLARDIVADGEGATKIVTVRVVGAKTDRAAEKIARTIANSPLVKTSLYGQDGNWGRIAGSIGASMAEGIDPGKIEICLDGICMFAQGGSVRPASRAERARVYKKKNIDILVNLHAGRASAQMLTCDLSKQYVEINAHYHT